MQINGIRVSIAMLRIADQISDLKSQEQILCGLCASAVRVKFAWFIPEETPETFS
jgi:hypothetical protein